MNHIFKTLCLVCPLLLTGCISIELPNLVSDTAKAGVNTYQNLKGKKRDDAGIVAHTYIGNNSQTVGEMKQHCESEAVKILRQRSNNAELRYTVVDNEIATANGTISANCRVVPAR